MKSTKTTRRYALPPSWPPILHRVLDRGSSRTSRGGVLVVALTRVTALRVVVAGPLVAVMLFHGTAGLGQNCSNRSQWLTQWGSNQPNAECYERDDSRNGSSPPFKLPLLKTLVR